MFNTVQPETFGGELKLVVWRSIFAIAKLKSANTFAMAIWGPTTKFNSCQYFRLYSICLYIGQGSSVIISVTNLIQYHDYWLVVVIRFLWCIAYTVVSQVGTKCPWMLNHNSQFRPTWAFTQDINSIIMFVWKLQQWSLEIGYMGAYPGVGACPGHYGRCVPHGSLLECSYACTCAYLI